jgi:hypothetical protein
MEAVPFPENETPEDYKPKAPNQIPTYGKFTYSNLQGSQ